MRKLSIKDLKDLVQASILPQVSLMPTPVFCTAGLGEGLEQWRLVVVPSTSDYNLLMNESLMMFNAQSKRGKNHDHQRTYLHQLKPCLLLGCCLGHWPGSQHLASNIPEGELP